MAALQILPLRAAVTPIAGRPCASHQGRAAQPRSLGSLGTPLALVTAASWVASQRRRATAPLVARAAGKEARDSLRVAPARRQLLGAVGAATAAQAQQALAKTAIKPTNEVLKTVDGIRQKRLGNSDVVVSELALGTQRWVSADFNAPDESQCQAFLDRAVLGSGVNLVDTAEQYPIPSDVARPEGLCEEVIGRWMAKEAGRRRKLVIATKITGGFNVTPKNIRSDCEGSLKRLGTDYIDVYQLHWPSRYSPQANWGQSLTYNYSVEEYGGMGMEGASFEELCTSMGSLIKEGKIRGWGLCNDNAFGLTACCETAKRLNVPPPISFQGDYSIIDRKSEENGVFEASSPIHENVGFMAYNALAGGMLTGKYLDQPAALDSPSDDTAEKLMKKPRGRMDTYGWGGTLYRYRSEAAVEAIAAYSALAKRAGLSLSELSLRWCRSRRGCTTVLLGTSSMTQLEEDLRYFQKEEPLPRDLLWEIDRVHMRNRLPIFSSKHVDSSWKGAGEIGEPIP
ncbi:tas [Symbiodinium natans]|uniref:Tas protein n=1 Tax=Symbiodinium natans TaxID=878477 RepID=A0A812UXK6_9DINO|nr:tas [Symbiodinium natans]